MSGINRLEGTPWHVEYWEREEGDPRRHRSRCQYYNREDHSCDKKECPCIGSAHCNSYREKSKEQIRAESKRSPEKPKQKPKHQQKKPAPVEHSVPGVSLPAGSRIVHAVYGRGEVLKNEDGRITVQFRNGTTKLLSLRTCIQNGLIQKQ